MFKCWLNFLVCLCLQLSIHKSFCSPAGYVFQRGSNVYKFVLAQDDRRSWYEAEEICQAEENGHLLTFSDVKERRWVDKLLSNLTQEIDTLGRFWIGANDQRLRGVYEFIDDSPFRYSEAPWARGEPNRPSKKDVFYEFCLVMNPEKDRSSWSDEDCYESYGYICKSKDIPKRLKDHKRFGFAWEWNYYVYKFVPLLHDTMTWSEAELYCKEVENGHLLSIYDPRESHWVTERIRQIRQILGFRGLWIGATDFFNRGSFKWTDENPMTYTKWTRGEPSNYSRQPGHRREACVAIHAYPLWGLWSDENCVRKMPFVCKAKKCKGKSDLGFIVDASGSVTYDGFLQAKEFIWRVISHFNITNNSTRVGLIRYSDFADLIFPLNRYVKAYQVKKAIFNMAFVQGNSKTELALKLARTKLFTKKGGSRVEVPKIVIVMTDGKSKRPKWVARAARKLRDSGVTIVAFGIGDRIDKKELASMASSAQNVLTVNSYEALSARVGIIRERICDEIIAAGRKKQREIEGRLMN